MTTIAMENWRKYAVSILTRCAIMNGKTCSCSERTQAGYRRYSQDSVKRLRFTRKARGLGFTLYKVKNFLVLAKNDDAYSGGAFKHKAQ